MMRAFAMQVFLDDPDALGYEVWQLNGCLIWDLALGFDITTDVIDKSFTFGWESEKPLESFEINYPIVPNPITGQPSVTELDKLS
jgi:hypothetical protein